MMSKWRVSCSFVPSSLLLGGWGIIVPFYTVQDCRQLLEIGSSRARYFPSGCYTCDVMHLTEVFILVLCTYQCYARGGWGPRDRVGTLIRNKNLESNFLTLGIRFQFKVPHLGEGFEFNIRHETENFKPSDHEVKNRCFHLTRLSVIVLLQ